MIHWEFSLSLKFEHSIKLLMYKIESILENEMHKIIWDLKVWTDPLILPRRLDLEVINNIKETKRKIYIYIYIYIYRERERENLPSCRLYLPRATPWKSKKAKKWISIYTLPVNKKKKSKTKLWNMRLKLISARIKKVQITVLLRSARLLKLYRRPEET